MVGSKAREEIKYQLGSGNSSRWQLFGYIFYYLFIPSLSPKWPCSSCQSDGPLALFLLSLSLFWAAAFPSTPCLPSSCGLRLPPSDRCIWDGAGCQCLGLLGAAAQESFSTHFTLISLAFCQLLPVGQVLGQEQSLPREAPGTEAEC